MVNIKQATWYYSNPEQGVYRYCPHCKAKVKFIDSGKRRQNANGKTIYHYAIYKCEKDHTWNCKLEQFKTFCGQTKKEKVLKEATKTPIVNLNNIWLESNIIWHIQVHLEGQTIRIDKLLAIMLSDISRNRLTELLLASVITLNGKKVKKNTRVRHGDRIIVNTVEL